MLHYVHFLRNVLLRDTDQQIFRRM